MLEILVSGASQISLTSGPGAESGEKRGSSVVTSSGRYPESTAGGCSDTSGALRSDDDFARVGYSYEHSEPNLITATPLTSQPSSSQIDPGSPFATFSAHSLGAQTLSALKQEAIQDRQFKSRNQKVRFTASSSKTPKARRGVPRTCKMMKEAYFNGMEWTRTFVSGPVDPKWNQYKFHCQICKANISIYSKGAREILRHHSTEKHLRKDQRWRHEYLYKIDTVSKARIPEVRGKDGKLLTPYQLAFELPKFKDDELVDIGEKLLFYKEFISGADYMSSSSGNRARVQTSEVGRFLPCYGDIDLLRNYWQDVGLVVNHQSLFTAFNWTTERLTVSFY